MNRRALMVLAATAIAVQLAPPFAGSAAADPTSLRERLIGTWLFVSSVNTRRDGSKFDRWGANPRGVFMFDPNGRYSQIILRSSANMFGSKAIFAFGTYTVDEASKTILTNIEGSSLSKMIGAQQKRIIKTLTADELRYVNPVSASGTSVEAIWKRSK